MNTLSWLIYAAEVSERVQSAFGLISILIGIFGVIGIGFLWVAALDNHVKEVGNRGAAIITALFMLVEAFFLSGALFLPSSRTIYMIAASEMGEVVVTSPEAKEMLSDLKSIIKRRLKEELGSD